MVRSALLQAAAVVAAAFYAAASVIERPFTSGF
jgi:hypothetical protein